MNRLVIPCSAIALILLAARGALASATERRLLAKLMEGYTNLERPVAHEADVLHVRMGLDFQQIIDVDEKNQMITTSLWMKLHWTDHNLQWNPLDYDNITDVRISSETLWRPDVLLYNSADSEFSKYFKTNIVVQHDGLCTFIPPGIFKSTCPIKIEYFPLDEQDCKLKFGSWTYSALKLNLTVAPTYTEQPERSSYIQNGEWDLLGIPAKWNVFSYECCPEPYVDITFTIQLRRRPLFYLLNLVIPCCLISSMTLLGFTLPAESGEKLTLAVTILLSLTVFLLVIADSMPATSDAVPLIGIYFSLIMVMTAFSVVFTVIVLNLHYRTPTSHAQVPFWVRKVLLEWLPAILRMQQHDDEGRPLSSSSMSITSCSAGDDDDNDGENNSSTSFNKNRLPDSPVALAKPTGWTAENSTSPAAVSTLEAHTFDTGIHEQHHHHHGNGYNYANINSASELLLNGNNHTCARHHVSSTRPPSRSKSGGGSSQLAGEVRSIVHELRQMRDRKLKEDSYNEACTDWKFAAAVLDRLFLWLMIMFTVIFHLALFVKAPLRLTE